MLAERRPLYRQLEELRGRPVIAYFTSCRANAGGTMHPDAMPELTAQLRALPAGCEAVDLLLASTGGDPTVAWQVVRLVRERVRSFSVLIPGPAFSAATLVALGADEIVMHRFANLGPVDPQITVHRDGQEALVAFAYLDLLAFLAFAKEKAGVSDQQEVGALLGLFAGEVGAVSMGMAARGAQLTHAMSEKLLASHASKGPTGDRAHGIATTLGEQLFHHGYPVGRTEARELGLPVVDPSPEVEALMGQIWEDVGRELVHREAFDTMGVLVGGGAAEALFTPADAGPWTVPGVPYRLVQALMEGPRCGSRRVVEGYVVGVRTADLQVEVYNIPARQAWEDADGGG